MQYKPEDKIYTIQAQTHTSLLRTIHKPRASLRCTHVQLGSLVAAVVLPLLVLSNVVAHQGKQSVTAPEENFHGAAVDVFNSIEDQKRMTDYYCNTVCSDTTPVTTDVFLRKSACLEVCAVRLPDAVVPEVKNISLELPTLIKNTTVEYTSEGITPSVSYDRKTPSNFIAMYLSSNTAANSDAVKSTISTTQSKGGNAVVIDVKGSYVYFHSNAELANEYGLVRPIIDLPSVIQTAHEMGVYVIGRYIAVKDPSLATAATETQIQNKFTKTGIGEVWVIPNHPQTLLYNKQIIEDLVDSGIDEINFDYIRYPTEYNQDAIGLTGEQKAAQLIEFLQMARNVVQEKNADTKLGVSTYAILGWNFPVNFEPLGQDIAQFAEVVDVISPMAYPSTFAEGYYYNPQTHRGSRNYSLVYRTLLGYKELLGDASWKLRPWIQGYYMTQKGIEDEMKAVYDAGLCGFFIWSAQNIYTEAYKALERVADHAPEYCIN